MRFHLIKAIIKDRHVAFGASFKVPLNIGDFEYNWTDYDDTLDEGCIIYNDGFLNIGWPLGALVLAGNDAVVPLFG